MYSGNVRGYKLSGSTFTFVEQERRIMGSREFRKGPFSTGEGWIFWLFYSPTYRLAPYFIGRLLIAECLSSHSNANYGTQDWAALKRRKFVAILDT